MAFAWGLDNQGSVLLFTETHVGRAQGQHRPRREGDSTRTRWNEPVEKDGCLPQEQMSCSRGPRQITREYGHAATANAVGHEDGQGDEREDEPSTARPTLLETKPGSQLDMLFREAEVIARNLKESGTRR